MKNILLLGANGQLGQSIQQLRQKHPNYNLIAQSREQINLSELSTIAEKITAQKPDYVINAAAYTAVDKAEEEPDLAMRINGDAVKEIALACEALKATLVHISTDYVFDGTKTTPYTTTCPTNPINVYGATKLAGEHNALNHNTKTFVVRTSWVHSPIGKNFETTMRRLFQEHEELKVVSDQIGRPTPAIDLAHYCLNLISKDSTNYGIHHFTGPQIMSWHGLATQLLKSTQKPVTQKILEIPTSAYPTPAKRPKYSVLEI